MLAVNPPGHFLYDAKTTDAQIRHYSELCKQGRRAAARRTNDLAASMTRTAADMPDHCRFLPIKQGQRRARRRSLGSWSRPPTAAPLSGPVTTPLVALGRKAMRAVSGSTRSLADLALPGVVRLGPAGSRRAGRRGAAQRYFASGPHRADSILGNAATEFVWAGGRLRRRVARQCRATTSTAGCERPTCQTLLIGGDARLRDAAADATRELLPYLPNGHQVVLSDLGHTTSFWSYAARGRHAVDQHLLRQRPGRQLALHARRRSTSRPRSRRRRSRKGLAGAMVGLALLAAAVAAAADGRRVRRRGGFGRKSSAMLRSVFPLVLGLGGWFLGVLIVVAARCSRRRRSTTSSSRALDRAAVGLGVYLAWVNGELAAQAGGSASPQPWRARSPAPGSGSTRRPGCSPSSPPSPAPSSARTSR